MRKVAEQHQQPTESSKAGAIEIKVGVELIDIADKELDNLFKEYETIMDKAYEGTNKATSTVSESGSKMGSSSGSSTSYSSTGTENPKTGDYTTLGASIATMIAGIAGIFVSRKR